MTELTLPFPPTVNNYYGCGRGGHKYIKQGGLDYRQLVDSVLRDISFHKYTVPIAVYVTLNYPDNKKRDLDNYMKALLDALTHSNLWEDDSLIHKLFIFKGETIVLGRVDIMVEVL